jgi:hypothetical protein
MRLMAAVDGASAARLQALSKGLSLPTMIAALLLAEESSKSTFNAMRENAGMLAAGVVVIVLWFLLRKMLELSETKKKD